jgi:Kdo2-lipid IVA lauroyltransferase/acyltransferase
MRKAAWLLEALLCIILSMPLAVLPLQWSIKAGEILGLLLFYLWGSRRKIAIENLSKSVSANAITTSEHAEEIIRNNFKNFGRSFAEVIKIFFGYGKRIIDSVDIEGIENFQNAASKGKGIIYITGHCGNWELLATALSVKVSEISVVARPIDNPYINNFVERVRRRYGNSVIYKKGALKPIMQTLKKNCCVGILMDQAVLADEGVVVDFLGRGAWTTKMPALIARKTDAAVLPVFIHRTREGHRIKIYPEAELSQSSDRDTAIKEDTKCFSAFIENYIKEYPTEWLWIHKRWKRVQENQTH